VYANRVTGEFRTAGERRAGRCASLAAKLLEEMESVKAAAGADTWHAGLSLSR
jgi:uridine phosphorylase